MTIKKLLANGDLAVIQEDGSHIIIDPQGNVKSDASNAKSIPSDESKLSPDDSLAEKVSGLTKEFSPFPTSMKQLQTPFSGRNPDVVTSPLEPLLALEKYGNKARETAIGRVPEGIGKTALRLATPFTPSELGSTASAVLPMAGAIPEFTTGRMTSGNIVSIPSVKRRVESVLPQIPEAIQSETDILPVSATKSGQEIQSSFERGFGKQEAAFNQAHQEAVMAADEANKAAQAAKEVRFGQGIQDFAGKYGSEPIGLREGGKNLQKSFKAKLDNYHNAADKVYEKLDAVSGKAPANPKGEVLQSQDLIKNVFEQRNIRSPSLDPMAAAKYNDWSRALQSQYNLSAGDIQQVLEQTDALASSKFTSESLDQSTLNAYKMMNNVIKKLDNPDLTVHDLSLIGSDVNRFAYKGNVNDPIKKVYQALGGALKEDIANASELAGFGDLSNNARAIWRNFKTLEQSKTAKIMTADPENIIPKIAKANSPTRVEELMKNVDPSAQNDFRRAVIDHAIEKAGGDIGKLAKDLGSRTAETNKAIFGEDAALVDRYAKFGKMIDEVKSIKPEIQKQEPFTPTETTTARIIRGQDAGNILDGLIGKGVDETRIKAAINGMDQQGREALKGGLLQKIKDDPSSLNKISDSILQAVYGNDSKLFRAYRQILNAKESYLKTTFVEDGANILTGFWPPRLLRGMRGIVNKAKFVPSVAEAQKSFPNLPMTPQATLRPYIASGAVQSGRLPTLDENR